MHTYIHTNTQGWAKVSFTIVNMQNGLFLYYFKLIIVLFICITIVIHIHAGVGQQ